MTNPFEVQRRYGQRFSLDYYSTSGHYGTKFNQIFFSCQRLFHLFLRPLYVPPTSFRAKTPKLYSSQNSWPVGPRAIIEQNLTEFFIFLQKVFPFISRTTIYAIYKFSCKNARIVFWSKFLTSGTQGHFQTKFTQGFFFLSWTSIYAIYKFSCKNANIVFQ